jgi:hypothetical protein
LGIVREAPATANEVNFLRVSRLWQPGQGCVSLARLIGNFFSNDWPQARQLYW